jgi:hypothetical protein
MMYSSQIAQITSLKNPSIKKKTYKHTNHFLGGFEFPVLSRTAFKLRIRCFALVLAWSVF